MAGSNLTQDSINQFRLTAEDIAHVAWDLVSVSQQGHAVQGGVTKEMVYSWAAAVLAAVPDEVLPQSAQQEFLIDMFRCVWIVWRR
jgi:hypothetical protein